MKCLKCGAVNKKTNEKCKKCGENLHDIETANEEIVSKEAKELVDEPKIENVKVETVEVPKEKKKNNFFGKLWTLIKIIIGILILATAGLMVYVYVFYDYNKYLVDNMNRYYETEREEYLENIKLVFKTYNYYDDKIEKMEDNSQEVIKEWIERLKDKDYKKEDEYVDSLNYLLDIIDDLYEKTEVEGHRAINKKAYISLSYEVKDLIEKTENKEENEEVEDKEYDVSFAKEIDLKGALELFDLNSTSVLFIGREDCIACNNYVPDLYRASNEYDDLKIYYLDINKINRDSEDFVALVAKFDKEYTLNIGGEPVTQSFGKWFGYTPMTLIIKEGKLDDGVIGAISYEFILKLFAKYF